MWTPKKFMTRNVLTHLMSTVVFSSLLFQTFISVWFNIGCAPINYGRSIMAAACEDSLVRIFFIFFGHH